MFRIRHYLPRSVVGSWSSRATICLSLVVSAEVFAQRTDDNAVASAEDAFGVNIGNEQVGLYTATEVRGFSPIAAGNIRIEGIYIDRPANFSDRLVERSTVQVGLSAQNYLFPAPTGIIDFRLRDAGAETVFSTVIGHGPLGGARLEVDAQLPIAGERLAVAAGGSIATEESVHGTNAITTSLSAAVRWRPTDAVEIIPFWSENQIHDREPRAVYITAGDFLPPQVKRHHYSGPKWAVYEGQFSNTGVIGTATLASDVRVVAGIFRSSSSSDKSFGHQLVGVTPTGLGRRVLHADPPHETASWSGEGRISRSFVDGDRLHTIHLSVRVRDRKSIYGGATTIELGTSDIEQPSPLPRPTYSFGERTFERVKQRTGGVSYEARWRGVGSLGIGLQRTDYLKTVSAPAVPVTATEEQSWLYNGTLAIEILPNLAVYGGYTRGLEESGVAPDSAVNRTQALPAIRTKQIDAGLRWALNSNIRAVLGVFDVSKPYFAADEQNIFTRLGEVTHRGIELSLTGAVFKGFNLVAGAVLLDPRVSGEPVEQGRIGKRPIGQTRRLLTMNANYAVPGVPGLTLTSNLSYHSGRVADRLNLVRTPAIATLGVGSRYRLQLAGSPALLQAQIINLTNVFEWRVVANSAFDVNSPRTFQASLTVDF